MVELVAYDWFTKWNQSRAVENYIKLNAISSLDPEPQNSSSFLTKNKLVRLCFLS